MGNEYRNSNIFFSQSCKSFSYVQCIYCIFDFSKENLADTDQQNICLFNNLKYSVLIMVYFADILLVLYVLQGCHYSLYIEAVE